MATSFPDSGLNFFARTIDPSIDENIGSVAVGSDDTDTTASDTDLGNLLQKTSVSSNNASITQKQTPGLFEATIRVAAGSEVEAGDKIRELGIFSNQGRLVFRTTRDPIEINAGESVNISFTCDFKNA